MKHSPQPLSIVFASVGILAVLAIPLYLLDLPRLFRSKPEPQPEVDPAELMRATPFLTQAIIQPPVVPAAKARLSDGEEVIGVVVDGHARAYRLTAFASMFKHVVNDMINDTPVSVTYCDLMNCVRVFTDEDSDDPLELRTGGYNKGMLLQVEGYGFYAQDNGTPAHEGMKAFPYDAMKFERMTWREWRARHPKTDVYEGIEGNPELKQPTKPKISPSPK